MNRLMQTRLPFFVAGGSLILAFCLMFLLSNPASISLLWYLGWLVWGIGMILIFLPMFVLRRHGGVSAGHSYVQTTRLVDSGIYRVVRHPQYLGWILMYLAMMLFNAHWLIVVLGLVGIVCVHWFTRQEDGYLVEKFGQPYERYMEAVPRLNPIAGVVKLVGRIGGSQAAGPDGHCVCPQCGYTVEHVAGQPCYNKKCPQCNTQLVRE